MSGAPDRVTVYVADDHPVYREGVALALRGRPEFELVGEGANGRAALQDLRTLQPDVAVLDVRMPGLDGHAVLRALQRDGVPTRVVFVSATIDDDAEREAVELGATAYLSKESTRERICEAIAAAARGDRVAAGRVSAAPRSLLSPREQEVLRLTADGLSGPAIGRELHLSPETVKTHLKSIYDKLGVGDRAAAVAEAMRRGLLD
ncbi:MAG: response regulator transcription factor [Solirubrobacterales bacterium]|nr:response regulator transcription factor [Solirubrobacterales bacterium]